jgi:hypothetical protein
LLSSGAFPDALAPRVCAAQSLAFTFGGRPLAFVRAQLSFVCLLLATIGHLLSLISDVISSGSEQFASFDLSLTVLERPLAVVKCGSPLF